MCLEFPLLTKRNDPNSFPNVATHLLYPNYFCSRKDFPELIQLNYLILEIFRWPPSLEKLISATYLYPINICISIMGLDKSLTFFLFFKSSIEYETIFNHPITVSKYMFKIMIISMSLWSCRSFLCLRFLIILIALKHNCNNCKIFWDWAINICNNCISLKYEEIAQNIC